MLYLFKNNHNYKNILDIRNYNHLNNRVEQLIDGEKIFMVHITGRKPIKRKKLKMAMKFLRCKSNLITYKTTLNIHIMRFDYFFYNFYIIKKNFTEIIQRILSFIINNLKKLYKAIFVS